MEESLKEFAKISALTYRLLIEVSKEFDISLAEVLALYDRLRSIDQTIFAIEMARIKNSTPWLMLSHLSKIGLKAQ